jgi:epoxyqueuosine reductase
VARYARGRDYHLVFEELLGRLEARIAELAPEETSKPYVDYGPVMERDHAQRAGLGWIGKNTMLINPRLGSYLLLGELLTTLDLPPDEPFTADRCGTCRRCIDACPTGAIHEAERAVDARLCISYLTIELRGSIPVELRPLIGSRVFGCDICQEVCPWNDDRDTGAPASGRPWATASMIEWANELIGMDEEGYRARYRDTALTRPRREQRRSGSARHPGAMRPRRLPAGA